jgi:hypothetical protein
VQVVDPALQRDGEVDEIGAAAAEQDALRGTQPADPRQEPGADPERDRGGRRGGDRNNQLCAQWPARWRFRVPGV